MAVGFTLLFVAMHLKAMRNEILRRRVKALQLAEVERARRASWRRRSRHMDLGMDWDRTPASSGRPTAIVVLVIGALIAWLVIDGREQERRLADFAARGVKRRSTPRS